MAITKEHKCTTSYPCADCCPGIGLFKTLDARVVMPNRGIDVTVTMVNGYYVRTTDYPCAGEDNTATDRRVCCQCGCTFLFNYQTQACEDDSISCDDLPTTTGNGGTTVKFYFLEMECLPGIGIEGGCNPPPDGTGAEAIHGGAGWAISGGLLNGDCTGPVVIDGISIFGFFATVMDCTSYSCICSKNGGTFYLKMIGGIFHSPGSPGADPIDPDGYIEITGTTSQPCPDDIDCSEILAIAAGDDMLWNDPQKVALAKAAWERQERLILSGKRKCRKCGKKDT